MATKRIRQVWMYLSAPEKKGEPEKVAAVALSGTDPANPDLTTINEPLIATDQAKLALMRPVAESLAKRLGRKLTLARFTCRDDIEEVG